ncbi:hypothetical protein BCR34DRAFT_607218 [Clohesyomyces aquaticus]|uniref:Uncharacterized protein n=1 Tax=Clohesyomyces aquaticus TaxID=1231657 RepID=A0A1Y1YI18_9PLEO|nr:hypothetical protein BCR34DRAFT_607218 [Clohesyomyces aquaticus]
MDSLRDSNGSGNSPSTRPLPDVSHIDVDLAEKLMYSNFGDPNAWSLEQLNNLNYMDRLIPPYTVLQFTDCLSKGLIPGGKLSSFPHLTTAERDFLAKPYSAWAPSGSGFETLNYSLLDRVNSDFFLGADDLCPYSPFLAKLQPLKARMWSGMVPMTGDRWLQKRLNEPRNCEQFRELVAQIVQIFMWWGDDAVRNEMKRGFAWLSEEFGRFGDAVNVTRAAQGVDERLDVRAMWEEYFRAAIATMVARTHGWIIHRAQEIEGESRRLYEKEYEEAEMQRNTEKKIAAGKEFLESMEKLMLSTFAADLACFLPMDGFAGHGLSTAGVDDMSFEARRHAYFQISNAKSWDREVSFKDRAVREKAFGERETLLAWFEESTNNRKDTRKQFRGEPKAVGDEHWITLLKSRIDRYLDHGVDLERQRWGFVCYRLTYDQSEEEWETMKFELEEDLRRAGEWVEGAEKVMHTAGLQWIDGRDYGIAEGDLEGAKRHFAEFSKLGNPDLMLRMWTQDFLVVDKRSYLSYAQPPPTPEALSPFGGECGHILLVDTSVYDPELIAQTSPGFTGSFRVLTSLIFDEVYPLIASVVQRPKDLWPLVRLHPWQLYVGPTVPTQEKAWDIYRSEKAASLSFFFKYMRVRQGKIGPGDDAFVAFAKKMEEREKSSSSRNSSKV